MAEGELISFDSLVPCTLKRVSHQKGMILRVNSEHDGYSSKKKKEVEEKKKRMEFKQQKQRERERERERERDREIRLKILLWAMPRLISAWPQLPKF
jgi:hypothetical protein